MRTNKTLASVLLVSLLILFAADVAMAQIWTVAAAKPKGTGRDASLPEAAVLSYRYDKQQDVVWFRIALYGPLNQQAFGVNLIFETGSVDAAKMNWWGANKAFKFDRLVTAWVTRAGNGYDGTMGVADANGVRQKQYTNLAQGNLQILTDSDAILIALKRTDVTNDLKLKLIAAVGSNQKWNDDLPGAGFATIDLAAERPQRGLREIDLGRNNFAFPADYKTLKANNSSPITRVGRGQQAMILIPGLYSGKTSFDDLIKRNESHCRFFVVTPPGLNGTIARSLPEASASFHEPVWTRSLEQDILKLIAREHLIKPIIVAEREPGSVASLDLALNHPEMFGGVVLVGSNVSQFMFSPKDPSRKTPATFEERTSMVDEMWAAKWFKYVTPETWISNDMRPEFLSKDSTRGQQASQEIEAALLPVKIRYLCEFWASDVTSDLGKLRVPVLALVPTFDEKFLADPANVFAKLAYVDSWERFATNNNVTVARIPGARLLVLQDEPEAAEATIQAFLAKNATKQNH